MSVSFPEVRVGDPLRHEALTIFPLFTEPRGPVEYLLGDEALRDGSIKVREVSEAGSVPELLVESSSDLRVLFLEGEELVGAKQNRVLNTSVLVAARSTTKIPVSCVEQGRWGYRSQHFASGATHSPSHLRYVLKASVARSLKVHGEFLSDQAGVWREVSRQQVALGASSDTSAMADTFRAHRKRLDDFRKHLEYVEGASGLAVAIADRVVAFDLFDKPSTCHKVWDRLLTGYILDALETAPAERQAGPADIRGFLEGIEKLEWQITRAVGEGEESRAESPDGRHASALFLGDVVIHASCVAGAG